ncbi:MAG: 50S ribosomal protein L25 [Arsenophonus sp.]|nr:MAG: 50S ribosomal protein L25 [Arsenophonus sp.]
MLSIYADIRKEHGKSASRKLRKNNQIPAIIYGKLNVPVLIKLNYHDVLNKKIDKNFFNTLNIIVDNNNILVKIKRIQKHPYKFKIIHIDFLYVN